MSTKNLIKDQSKKWSANVGKIKTRSEEIKISLYDIW